MLAAQLQHEQPAWSSCLAQIKLPDTAVPRPARTNPPIVCFEDPACLARSKRIRALPAPALNQGCITGAGAGPWRDLGISDNQNLARSLILKIHAPWVTDARCSSDQHGQRCYYDPEWAARRYRPPASGSTAVLAAGHALPPTPARPLHPHRGGQILRPDGHGVVRLRGLSQRVPTDRTALAQLQLRLRYLFNVHNGVGRRNRGLRNLLACVRTLRNGYSCQSRPIGSQSSSCELEMHLAPCQAVSHT